MIGLNDLTNADPNVFSDLADHWDRLAGNIAGHYQDWQTKVRGSALDTGWTGTAGDAARQHVTAVQQRFAGHVTTLRQVSATLRQSAVTFTEAQSQVATLRQQASRLGLTVGADGSVSLDPSRLASAALTDPKGFTVAAEAIGKALDGVVVSANDADRRAATALDSLTPHDATPTAGPGPAGKAMPTAAFSSRPMAQIIPVDDGPTFPPSGVNMSDPKAVKQWWDGLSPQDQKQYADAYPQQIGAQDGIPSAVRDYCNRQELANLRLQAQGQIDQLRQQEPQYANFPGMPSTYQAAHDQWVKDMKDLQTKTDTLDQLATNLGPGPATGPGGMVVAPGYDSSGFPTTDIPPDDFSANPPQRFLLGVDTKDVGRLIVATNNPDAAHNVVTAVPGVGSGLNANSVNDASGANGMANNILGAVNAQHGQPTAVVYWDNYSAPPQAAPGIGAAAFQTDAQQGAPALAQFDQGLNATHNPTDVPHTVLLGHSYGSTVVGEASKLDGGLGAQHINDVIAVGSPGMDVDNASSLSVDPGPPSSAAYPHVWAARTSNDVIQYVENQTAHDTDPVSQGFGANVFNAGDGPSNPLDAHGYYFVPGSPGLNNIANIVNGNYVAVTPGPVPQSPPPTMGRHA